MLKVACICHFSNKIIREKLPLSKMRAYNFLRFILGKQKIGHTDFAPWVSALIKEFEKVNDAEFHIIAPHTGLKVKTFEFEMNGVFFHFFRSEDDTLYSRIVNRIFPNKYKEYKRNKKIVKDFITKINPDIVNLIGTENPYYSITVLGIENKPIVVSMQTVYSNPNRLKLSGEYNQYRAKVEQDIFKVAKYYITRDKLYRDLILQNTPDGVILKGDFPVSKTPSISDCKVSKIFDFVFFAQSVSSKKGANDAIEAMALVKNKYPDVRLAMVGFVDEYKKVLDEMIARFNLSNNIIFHNYFPVHSDMYQYIQQARFALLPVKMDTVSSTILEAMYIGLPVVTYKTSGTPYLNKEKECVLLSEIGDIQGLAGNMLKLLNSEELAEKLRKNAKEYYLSNYDNSAIIKCWIDSYRAVINHYYNGTPIPKGLLFD